ncbi:TPA: hypothetical protein R8G43_004142 [Citrobacter freundii]|uniref:hypothetical protein n=1 Tax=Citrobacter freundii TaxID=546 RepID=UPI0023B1D552|nr:hypothetical protein [Citrobacter freundii]MDE8797486.1 hypothetical protein [Citrobacter freundii]MEC5781312.1 hypothetical protein [Citrobacter freundii]HEE9834072.1 hypothetical protein [Citrobacter freundii]HEE9892316.1 hypothetical protein [Citrobacter freundii]HEE9948151.1 hypothetical protein [Citrobacter freundii]
MTTNNHPAHGPVSLDRLHQISEILSKAAAQSDGGNLGYAMADAVKVIDGVIAAFDAEPVGYFYADKPGDWYQISDADRVPEHRRIPLYSKPQSWPAVKLPNEFISSEGIVVQIEKVMAVLAVAGIQYERKGGACRAAMLQANYRDLSQPVDPQVAEYEEIMNQAGNSPSECSLREGIEAIRNSGIPVDVDKIQSECDAGNSPATPDGWVMVPVEPTEAMINAYRDALYSGEPAVSCIDLYMSMIAAAPQQEVKSALEHGMRRYAGAMQKLSEGDK